MQIGMLSPTKEGQDCARYMLLHTKDYGKSWLKGGWKDEMDADTIGRDIGADTGVEWIEKKRDAMEQVSEQLGIFSRL